MDNYRIVSVKKTRRGVTLVFESVEYEDTREITLSEELWDRLPFGKDDVLTSSEIDETEAVSLTKSAFEYARSVMSYSGHSRAGLIRKLCQKGFPKEIAESAADMAESQGFLNEDREAGHKANYYLCHKRWGKRRITAELLAKGYARSAVQNAVDSLDEDMFSQNLAYLIEKKPVPSDKNGRQKYIAALCRMGYSTGEIIDAIKSVRTED